MKRRSSALATFARLWRGSHPAREVVEIEGVGESAFMLVEV